MKGKGNDLDNLDKYILMELSKNCRISFSFLAKKAQVSPNTIKNRYLNLLKQKIILASIIEFNPVLFNANYAFISFYFKKQISEDLINHIGNNEIVISVGFGSNTGFATLIYRTNEELSKLSDFFSSLKDIDTFEIFPILLPFTSEYLTPLDTFESLQPLDWLLLYHLRTNGRMPLSQLAKKTQVTVKTIRKRLNSLLNKNMIRQTIWLNPGAISKGLMVIFKLEYLKITRKFLFEIEKEIKNIHKDNFWVSWQVVDRPIILLAFQAASSSEVNAIKNNIIKITPHYNSISQVIGGEMRYFPDFTDRILEEKKRQNWFSTAQWERISNRY